MVEPKVQMTKRDLNLSATRESQSQSGNTNNNDNNEVIKMTVAEALKGGLLDKCPPGSIPSCVKKEVVHHGSTKLALPPYPSGSRIRFHFVASSMQDGKVFDDSRTHPKPMEIILGKKFKVEIWEIVLNTMLQTEVSKFFVPKGLCLLYPMVAKVLRDNLKGDEVHRTKSCCGSMMQGVGYPDLDELLKMPVDITFTFELLEVRAPGEYEMEAWYMTDEQKVASVETLHEQGNSLFSKRHYKAASDKYLEALSLLEQLMNKEAPGTPEMNELKAKKVPLHLNHAFCRQKNKEYYDGLKHINMALEIEPDNVKGLFRRGQCYKFLFNFDGARADFTRALGLDSTLRKAVKEEMEAVKLIEEMQTTEEKQLCQKMFSTDLET